MSSLLDIGAGPSPYRKIIENCGIDYVSHDFEQYSPDLSVLGLQSSEWPVSGHDLVCNIDDLPVQNFDFALCTEVLEHVPDPVSALKSIRRTLRVGGEVLITVPFASRMHQGPYWFSSGLSHFWFEHHAPLCGFEIKELTIAGDFVCQMIAENKLFLGFMQKRKFNLEPLITRCFKSFSNKIRNKLPEDLINSGGLGVYEVLSAV